jgi:hypothetical protein
VAHEEQQGIRTCQRHAGTAAQRHTYRPTAERAGLEDEGHDTARSSVRRASVLMRTARASRRGASRAAATQQRWHVNESASCAPPRPFRPPPPSALFFEKQQKGRTSKLRAARGAADGEAGCSLVCTAAVARGWEHRASPSRSRRSIRVPPSKSRGSRLS